MADLTKLFDKTGIQKFDSSTKTFSTRKKVSTPLVALDAFLGGGIPLGCIVEVAGPKSGGKSSFCYQTLGNFQKEYPDGIAILFESEVSHDNLRMTETFDIDLDRLYIYPGVTLNGAFKSMIELTNNMKDLKAKERVPIFILWDSITNSATDSQIDSSDVNGGGLAEAARLIRQYFKILMANLSDVDIMIMLISQVSQKIGGYVGGFTTSGGEGLAHDVHFKIWIDQGKSSKSDDGLYEYNSTSLSLKKSKISPLIEGIPIQIDIRKGGYIDKESSLFEFLFSKEIISQVTKGWYSINPNVYARYPQYSEYITNCKLTSKMRWSAIQKLIISDPNILDIFTLVWVDIISNHYALQAVVCKEYRELLVDRLKSIENEVTEEMMKALSDATDNNEDDED